MDLVDADAEHIAWLDSRGVEEDDFDIFALGQGVELLQDRRDGVEVCEVDAEGVDFDGAGAFGDEGRVIVLEAVGAAGEQDDVLDAFLGEGEGDVLGGF